MTTDFPLTTQPPATPGQRDGSRLRWPWWVFRTCISISTILVFGQAILAGQILSGVGGALFTHRENATYAGVSVIISTIAALLLRWPGRGPWQPIVACLALFALIALQIRLGFLGLLAWHVPLGVLIITLTTVLAFWTWRSGPGRRPVASATGRPA
jgi:hypothetical protein